MVAPRRRFRPFRFWLGEAFLVVAVLLGGHLYMARGTASGSAPPLEGTGLDGKPLSLASLRGKPVLVHFWATWCPVCHQEDRSIDALARDHQVLTVAVGSGGTDRVDAYLQAHRLQFPVLVDPGGRLSQAYGVSGFPSSFVVDRDGRIRFVEVGFTTELGLRARMWLAGL